jgi:D-amino-acid oxidase
MDVVVVGAGVSGLSVAWKLLERGHAVRVIAREPPMRTTSAVAAALWTPFEVEPEARVTPWALASLAAFQVLAREPGSGVSLHSGTDLEGERRAPPAWLAAAGGRVLAPQELPPGAAAGWCFRAPVIEMPIYLAFLERRVRALGGTFEEREVRSLSELERLAEVAVVCVGLGARELCGDRASFPIRGQIVRVANPGLADFRTFHAGRAHPEDFGYVIPRSRDVVLGGTAERGCYSLAPRAEETRAILARCARHEPGLAGLEPLSVGVGLRPGRDAVRLEAERTPRGLLLVHNYGHGGGGVTLSIGCAEEVVRVLEREGARAASVAS